MRAVSRVSLAKLKRLERARGVDEAGRANVLTREGADVMRRELLFGRAGPTYGSGPAKVTLLTSMIVGGREDRPALIAQARAHYRDAQDATDAERETLDNEQSLRVDN